MRIGSADLKHHTDQVVDINVRSIGLVDERQEFVTEFDNGLSLLLSCIKELLPPKVDGVDLKKVVDQDVDAGHEALNGGVPGRSPCGLAVDPGGQCFVDSIVEAYLILR